MEFFLQFFFQPISRAVRLTIGGPLPLTYSSLNSTLQRFVDTFFPFLFTLFRSIFLYRFTSLNQLGIAVIGITIHQLSISDALIEIRPRLGM